eukprot:COSAG02_NODE_3960_length_5982_cov_3.105048_1_plen_59_part_00
MEYRRNRETKLGFVANGDDGGGADGGGADGLLAAVPVPGSTAAQRNREDAALAVGGGG